MDKEIVSSKTNYQCTKEDKKCRYLKPENKCGLRKRWCVYCVNVTKK